MTTYGPARWAGGLHRGRRRVTASLLQNLLNFFWRASDKDAVYNKSGAVLRAGAVTTARYVGAETDVLRARPLSLGAGIKARGQRSLETDALEGSTSGALDDHDLTATGRPLLRSPVDQRPQKNSRHEQSGQNPASEFHLSPERRRRG